MKQYLSLFVFLSVATITIAQQDRQLTHFNFDRMSYNPSTTGFNGICGTFIYRNQWDRVQDAPNTTVLNLQSRIPLSPLGVGLSMSNDAIGFQRNNRLTANVAYHLSTTYGSISAGIGIGLINVGFSPAWVPPQTPYDPYLPEPTAGTAFDMNFGLFWHGNSHPYYIGISSTHLAPATLKNVNYSIARHYYVLAGYNYTINRGRQIDLKPSVLVKADGATAIFDLNVGADVWLNTYSFLWGGITYRMSDAIAINVGYARSPARIPSLNMMKIGYSFDIMTNALNVYGKGTHELMLNFCLFPPPPTVGRHGNPFILF